MSEVKDAQIAVTCPGCKERLEFNLNGDEGNTEAECDNCEHTFSTHIKIEVDVITHREAPND